MTISLEPAHYVVAATVKSSAIEIVTILIVLDFKQVSKAKQRQVLFHNYNINNFVFLLAVF